MMCVQIKMEDGCCPAAGMQLCQPKCQHCLLSGSSDSQCQGNVLRCYKANDVWHFVLIISHHKTVWCQGGVPIKLMIPLHSKLWQALEVYIQQIHPVLFPQMYKGQQLPFLFMNGPTQPFDLKQSSQLSK